MKVISFTAGRDSGWSCVTPAGLVTVERGQQVTLVVSESWDQAAQAIRILQQPPEEAESGE